MPSQISVKELLQMAQDICLGCAYLEQIRHVHRDLAGRNCLLSSKDPKLRVVKVGKAHNVQIRSGV